MTRTRRTTTTTLTALLLTGALALSACGDEDDSTTTIGSEGVVTSGPTSDARADASADTTPGPGASPDATAAATGGGADAVPAAFRDHDAELDVEDQSGDGSTVVVEEVRLSSTDGFVAIFTEDGETLLGHAAVARSGDERRLDVTLVEPVSETQRLLAVLYADDGDGAFDPDRDPRVTDDHDEDHDDDDGDDLETDRFTYRVQ